MRRWVSIYSVVGRMPWDAGRPVPEEEQAIKAASESFRLTYYERAEKDFADFIQKFPNSERVRDAIFFQAEARLKQSNFAGTVSLLTTNLATAGPWADKYLYCLGQAYLGLKAFDKAADAFGRLAREFPASTHRLEATTRKLSPGRGWGPGTRSLACCGRRMVYFNPSPLTKPTLLSFKATCC